MHKSTVETGTHPLDGDHLEQQAQSEAVRAWAVIHSEKLRRLMARNSDQSVRMKIPQTIADDCGLPHQWVLISNGTVYTTDRQRILAMFDNTQQ